MRKTSHWPCATILGMNDDDIESLGIRSRRVRVRLQADSDVRHCRRSTYSDATASPLLGFAVLPASRGLGVHDKQRTVRPELPLLPVRVSEPLYEVTQRSSNPIHSYRAGLSVANGVCYTEYCSAVRVVHRVPRLLGKEGYQGRSIDRLCTPICLVKLVVCIARSARKNLLWRLLS